MMGIPQTGTLAVAAAAAFLSAACTLSIDTGETVTKSFDVADFDELEIGHAFDATVVVGEATDVEFEISDELLDKLEVEVVDGRLVIGLGGGLVATSGPMNVTIATPELSLVDVSGAANLDLEDVDATDFELNIDGAANVDVAGSVETLDLEVNGAARADLDNLTVQEATVDVDGASTVDIGDVQSVSGSVSGASTINVPDSGSIDIDSSGASSVNMG